MGLLDWLPSRRRLARERAEAEREAADTTRREHEADAEIRKAYKLAHTLASHRERNHFAERMRAAYRGESHA